MKHERWCFCTMNISEGILIRWRVETSDLIFVNNTPVSLEFLKSFHTLHLTLHGKLDNMYI